MQIQQVIQRGNLTWATVDDTTRLDGASVVSLAGHEGSVIVLGKMQDGQIITHRDDGQDILLMVSLVHAEESLWSSYSFCMSYTISFSFRLS